MLSIRLCVLCTCCVYMVKSYLYRVWLFINLYIHIYTHRLLIQYLKEGQGSTYCCASCNQPLAYKSHIFTVHGIDGIVGNYVNAHGIVHQTVTLSQCLPNISVLLFGPPTASDSWFPGYSWTIAYCQCMNHLGWLFTKTTLITQSPWAYTSNTDSNGIGSLRLFRETDLPTTAQSSINQRPETGPDCPSFW